MPTLSEPSLPSFFEQRQLSIGTLKHSSLPLEETTYLTIGAGVGSFIWVDHLIIHGVDPTTIVALGLEARPYARFRRLCRNSQILDHDRLRSAQARLLQSTVMALQNCDPNTCTNWNVQTASACVDWSRKDPHDLQNHPFNVVINS